MKKVVLSLAIVAAMFVSCKENAAEGEVVVDSTTVEVPVIETEEVVVDTTTVEVPVTTTTTTEVEAAPVK